MTNDPKCSSCSSSSCETQDRKPEEPTEEFYNRQQLTSRMSQIQHKIMVLSGKGGVGKSTVAVNLATSLAMAEKRVGLLDVDIHGPSVPKLLHIENASPSGDQNTLYPVEIRDSGGLLKVMSIGLLLEGRDDAVIWRGPMKQNLITSFLRNVEWGELDFLIVDAPPGTGDEPLTVAQSLNRPTSAIIVTTPQEIALQDVRRSITFCRQVNLSILGVIENMSGFSCPHCGEFSSIFGKGGGAIMAQDMDVPFLGSIPIEPDVVTSGDGGTPIVQTRPDSNAAKMFNRIAGNLLELPRS